MRFGILLFASVLSGCIATAEVQEVPRTDGSADLDISCVGDIFYEHQCVDKAKERCPQGYSVVSDNRTFRYINTGSGLAVHTTRHYRINCSPDRKKP